MYYIIYICTYVICIIITQLNCLNFEVVYVFTIYSSENTKEYTVLKIALKNNMFIILS